MKKNLAIIGGFQEDYTPELQAALKQHLPNIHRSEIILSCPPLTALQHPRTRIASIRKRLKNLTDEHPTIVICHSYGALIGLTAAAELEFENMPIGLYINGPLNPEISIPVPEIKPHFALFYRHFALRDKTAQDCALTLDQLDGSKYKNQITFGTELDNLVPHSAHNMPGLRHQDFTGTNSHSLSRTKIDQIIKILTEHDV